MSLPHEQDRAMHDWKTDTVRGNDGVWIFWPEPNTGAYPAHLLRTIADHLDNMNSEDSK
jgi:hypothetical protein